MRVRKKVYRSVSGADTPPGKVFDDFSCDTAKFIITGQYIIVFLLLCSKKYEAVSICMSASMYRNPLGESKVKIADCFSGESDPAYSAPLIFLG